MDVEVETRKGTALPRDGHNEGREVMLHYPGRSTELKSYCQKKKDLPSHV